jgi:aminopeptidase N
MWAISELVNRTDERRVIDELVTSAQSDSFWAVRRDAVYRLGGFRGIIQMDLDRNLIPQSRLDSVQMIATVDRSRMNAFFRKKALDENSQVRAAALYALGNLMTKEEAGFLKERFETDDSYLAQAAALRALGKCGDASFVTLLKKAMTVRSPRNVIGSAAEWALARISQKG